MNTASDGQVTLARAGEHGEIATITFDRPAARNAMTWSMYEELAAHCRTLADDASVRVVVFRGAGGEAFVAGTDIAQFRDFDGDRGVAYEKQIDEGVERVERLPMPTIALIEGWTVGGGLALATACDFRFATPKSRFGVPIAKTLGNTLSIANLARLEAAWGVARVKRMLLAAEMLTAEDALAAAFLREVCAPEEIAAKTSAFCAQLAALAPVTQAAIKEGLRRIVSRALPEGDDLIRRVYGSADFAEGVDAFVAKRPPRWNGR